MSRFFAFVVALCALVLAGLPRAVDAAEMTFQFINSSEHPISVKLFSRGESRQVWPSVSRAYSVRPDPAAQQLKVTCKAEEPVCWGAFLAITEESGPIGNGQRQTRNRTAQMGVGERGQRPCDECCHVCTDGKLVAPVKLNTRSDPAVR